MEENNNVLFNQDDLVQPEPQNNLENGYTEELDFLQPAMEQATVAPEPVQEEAPVAPVYQEAPVEDAPVEPPKPTYMGGKQAINENPMGKIKLNKEEESVQEQIDPASIKLDFKGNKNLKFVIALGILLLLAVIIIPMILFK